MQRRFLALWLLLCPAAAAGQDAGAETKPPPRTIFTETSAEVRFGNGSSVYMNIDQPEVEIETDFGKLTIPTKDIRIIEFGLHLEPEVEKRVETMINALGSATYRTREKAAQELIRLGVAAYPALKQAKDTGDAEAGKRVQAALEAIEQSVPAKLLQRASVDTIWTSKFPVTGKITTPEIAASSDYFGGLKLRPGQLFSIRWLKGSGRTAVQVDASKYTKGDGAWLKTNVLVTPKLPLKLAASGKADLYPASPGQVVAGPEGLDPNYYGVPSPAAPGAAPPLGGPGALLGKIGESGAAFLVGREKRMTPGEAGLLYLRIVPSPNSEGATGSYDVQVLTGPFAED